MNGSLFSQLTAIARRDWATWRSYHFQLGLRLVAVAASLVSFFYISRLVGDADEVARYGGYFEFALAGLILMTGTGVALHALGGAIGEEQSAGTLEVLLAAPIRLYRLILGGMIIPIALFLVEVVIMLLVAAAFGVRFPLVGLALSFLLLMLTMGTFIGLSTISTAFTVLTKRGDPVGQLVTQASNLLAGSLFPVALLPAWLEVLSRFVPTFYGLRGIRAALFEGAGLIDVLDEMGILLVFSAVLFPIGLRILKRAMAEARVTGTLGNY